MQALENFHAQMWKIILINMYDTSIVMRAMGLYFMMQRATRSVVSVFMQTHGLEYLEAQALMSRR